MVQITASSSLGRPKTSSTRHSTGPRITASEATNRTSEPATTSAMLCSRRRQIGPRSVIP